MCAVAGQRDRDILAALAGSPELRAVRRCYQQDFIDKCAQWLGPFAVGEAVPATGLWAILGAAETLSEAVAAGAVEHTAAEAELERVIVAIVKRGS